MSKLRVVVCDDHPVFREGLVTILGDLGDIEVVAEASNGREAIAAVEEHRPDVALMDLRMPEMTGIEATAHISQNVSDTKVLALTMNEDDESVLAALKAGATGYLLKESTRDEIASAIQTVAQGQAVFGAGVTKSVMAFLASAAPVTPSAGPFAQLSEREYSVLELMARGLDNASIARKLYVSEKTVRNNVSLVFAKLGVESRAAAIALAHEKGVAAS